MKQNSGKYCGNCFSHSAYEYPKKIFCERKFRSGLSIADSVKDTLDTCEDWKDMGKSRRCNCVEGLQNLLKASSKDSKARGGFHGMKVKRK
jgi:hypothetical protein